MEEGQARYVVSSEAWYFFSPQDRSGFGLFWSTLCLFYKRRCLAAKVGKTSPSSCGTTKLKYLFEAVIIILPVKCVFTLVKFTNSVLLPSVGDDEWSRVNARIAGCKLTTSARITFFFSLIREPYNKQLNNLDRSVVTGKSQTSAYRIDLAIARSIRQGLSLRFSRNDLTLIKQLIIRTWKKLREGCFELYGLWTLSP